MNNRIKYSTKFSNLTLAIGEEPNDFLVKRSDWQAGRIYNLLRRISIENKLPMVNKRTLYLWINKINSVCN